MLSGGFRKKYSNVLFNGYTSNGRRVVPRRWTDRQTNLTIAFHNFANATIKDITTADFFSKSNGMLAGGNKSDLTDKLRGL